MYTSPDGTFGSNRVYKTNEGDKSNSYSRPLPTVDPASSSYTTTPMEDEEECISVDELLEMIDYLEKIEDPDPLNKIKAFLGR